MTDSPKSLSMVDIEQALTYTAGDAAMLLSIAELFCEEGSKQLQSIEQQIDASDTKGIARAAHQLKGSIVIFGAKRAAQAALHLEKIARSGDLSAVPDAWQRLNSEMEYLTDELRGLPDLLPEANKEIDQ